MKNTRSIFLLAFWITGITAICTQTAEAQYYTDKPVNVGRANNFVILSNSGIANSHNTTITGNIGAASADASITGLSPGEVNGTIFTADTTATPGSVLNTLLLENALADAEAARADIIKRCYDFPEIFEGDLSGQTLIPGVYEWTGGAVINADMTIEGEADDFWVFKVIGPLTQAANTKVVLKGEARAENIFWYITETATIGQNAVIEGIILGSENVVLGHGAAVNGKIFTQNEIILNNNIIVSDQNPELTVTKTANKEFYNLVGEEIDYTIIVNNTGNVPITDIQVTDPLTGMQETIPNLEPLASVTFNQTYAVTVSDIYNGTVVNTATATGKDPQGQDVTGSGSATATVLFYRAELVVEKSADRQTFSEIGEVITYTVVVRNAGSVTIFDIDVLDPLTEFTENIESLKPCNRRTYTINYTATYEDMCRGFIHNTASAIGVDSRGDFAGHSDEVTITGDFDFAELSLEKTAEQQHYSVIGEQITYQIRVSNTGHVPINNLLVADPLTGLNEIIDTLMPCTSLSFSGVYEITLEDIENGSVVNTATATGKDPSDQNIEASDQEIITAIIESSISIDKKADQQTYNNAGDTIDYTILVKNTGNISLIELSIEDDLTGESWLLQSLEPGISHTLSTSYVITQADMDAGSVTNTAVVTAQDVLGGDVIKTDQEVVHAIPDPGITITKTAETSFYSTPGELISYDIVVENTGNLTIYNVAVTDSLTGDNWSVESLAPGMSASFIANYEIKQSDLDTGLLTNLAFASGLTPFGENVDDSGQETIEALLDPSLQIAKTTSQTAFSLVGELITYAITVRNDGNLTIRNVQVSDDLTGDTWTIDTLMPGEEATFSANYMITQQDLDNGFVTNNVHVSGEGPQQQTVEDQDSLTVSASTDTKLVITKTANQENYSILGEQIVYTIVMENTGNVSISDIILTDDLTNESWSIPNLLPNTSETRTTNYLVTQEDLDSGSIINLVTAIGKDPEGNAVSANAGEEIFAIVDASLSLQKTADRQVYAEVGETISYSIVLTNTGNVTISNIDIVDNLTSDTWLLEILPPGVSRSYMTTYTVNQTDLDAGNIENLATANGLDPAGLEIEASDDETIYTTELVSSLSVTKNADVLSYSSPGEQITYTIVVTNTGQLTISDVDLTDDLTGDSWVVESIAPGASASFTANYLITQEDIDRGSVTNQAAASGVDPRGQQVHDNDDETITADMDPSISISKTASPSTYSSVGDQILYAIVVQNNGNVTLSDVDVHDDLTGESWFIESLPPGSSRTFNTSIIITQQHIDEGVIRNVATVSGKDPVDNTISDTAEETVGAVNRQPALDVTKSSERPVYAVAGDVIEYTIVVTNTGNLTIQDINVTDNLTNGTWFIPVLGPGESQTFQTTYQVTKADVDFGQVVNLARAEGTDPDGNLVEDSDEETAIAIKVPGGLTPDTPYDNILIIKGLDYYPNNAFRIFNRYGTLVYEASPYRNDWVGVPNRGRILTDADGKVPAGTYFYLLVLEPGQKPFSGYIYLIKN